MTKIKAMILAAGRGERMRPLTDTLPKPLVKVGDKSLIVHHIERLVAAGISDIVINHAHLGDQIEAALGNGSAFSANIVYSPEPSGGLETAGGIIQALPLLGEQAFLLVNGDVWTDYDFSQLAKHQLHDFLAHLLMVKNPPQKTQGDFFLNDNLLSNAGEAVQEADKQKALTFAGISMLSPQLFAGLETGHRALAPLFREAMNQSLVSGEFYDGDWEDVGTIGRLKALRQRTVQ